jgi:hypothetical protein
MTEAYEDEGDGHTCGGVPMTAQRWSWWYLWAVCWNLGANVCKSLMEFCLELSAGLYRHGLHKMDKKADVEVVDTFREQLKAL